MLPIFDNRDYIKENAKNVILPNSANRKDFNYTLEFLKCYTASIGTFNSYRREVERLLQWCWVIKKINLKRLNRELIEEYIGFCLNPPENLISNRKISRFINSEGKRIPNSNWKPFVITPDKFKSYKLKKANEKPDISEYSVNPSSLQNSFAILSTFFNFLIAEKYLTSNPMLMIRQKNQYFRKCQTSDQKKRLTPLQCEMIIKSLDEMKDKTEAWKERTRFLLNLFLSLYLRISEVTSSERWTPTMNDFYKDSDGNWWFTTVGKGNKKRTIAVSDGMLDSLKRWRNFLGLTSLPTPADDTPLIPKIRGKGVVSETSYIRRLIQSCFDKAADSLIYKNIEESESLRLATVHWLRHTGISEDVKTRPLPHVRDDAGHESIATTNKYINTLDTERHRTAKNKAIIKHTIKPRLKAL